MKMLRCRCWRFTQQYRLSSSQFFTTEYSYLVFPNVAGRKPLSGTQNSPVVSQVSVNEMYLTKRECLMYRCPLLSLSRPSTEQMKSTLLEHFLWCSLTHPEIDGSNLPILHWLWKRCWGHKLRGIYIYIWSDECHVCSLVLALKNTKLWVELIGSNLPSTGEVIYLFVFFSL